MSTDLVGAVLSAVLGGRRKKSRRSASFLGRRGGGLINARTIMAVAGLAWGAYESWRAKQTAVASPTSSVPAAGSDTPNRPGGAAIVPPPIPGPGPNVSGEATERLLRLAVAAANADGSLSAAERVSVASQARAAGASDALVESLSSPLALADLLAGVSDVRERTTLYVLAFTIVRADEQVVDAERAFLREVAQLLALDPAVVASLEASVAHGIDTEP